MGIVIPASAPFNMQVFKIPVPITRGYSWGRVFFISLIMKIFFYDHLRVFNEEFVYVPINASDFNLIGPDRTRLIRRVRQFYWSNKLLRSFIYCYDWSIKCLYSCVCVCVCVFFFKFWPDLRIFGHSFEIVLDFLGR